MASELDTRQSVNRDQLPILNTDVNAQLNSILSNLNVELDVPLRLAASFPIPDSLLHVRASKINAADRAEKSAPPVAGSVVSFVDSTIDFLAGITAGGTFLPNTGANTITLPTSTVGFYVRAGFSLLSDGTVQVIFSPQSGTLVGLVNAGTLFISNSVPIGWIDLQAVTATTYKTADSSSNIIENSVSGVPTIHRFGNGSGSGSADSSGSLNSDIISLAYKANFNDDFSANPLVPANLSPIDITSGHTDSTLYFSAYQYYRVAYDATRTVTGAGTAMTLSGTPSFTVKVGDILRVAAEARRITVVTSQVLYTIEAAFSANPSVAAATVSQAVYTVDLNAYVGDGVAVSSLFTTNISSMVLAYNDTITAGDIIPDNGAAAAIAATASADGSSYTSVYTRPDSYNSQLQTLSVPIAGTQLKIRFFSNKTSGSGFVNILDYRVYFHRQDLGDNTGTSLNTAYLFTDGTGTEINCLPPTVVSGKTRITLNFTYTTGIQSGTPNGQLNVYINGQKIPRFVDGTITPDASYTEVASNIIDLDSNYSGFNFAVEIDKPVAFIDYSESNSITLQTSNAPDDVQNYSVVTSESGNALTIALKNPAGQDPSTLNPVRVSFRDSVASNGVFNKRIITVPVSLTISSGSTLGHANATSEYIYVYLVDNAGVISLAVITDENLIDEGTLQSTVAEGGAGAADSRTVLYTPSTLSSKPVRLIARLKSNQVVAGTWVTPISEVSLLSFEKYLPALSVKSNPANAIGLVSDLAAANNDEVLLRRTNALIFAKINANNLGNNSVTAPAIASNAVTAPAIANNAVTASAIANNAVTTSAILDANITLPKLATETSSTSTTQSSNRSFPTAIPGSDDISTTLTTVASRRIHCRCVDGGGVSYIEWASSAGSAGQGRIGLYINGTLFSTLEFGFDPGGGALSPITRLPLSAFSFEIPTASVPAAGANTFGLRFSAGNSGTVTWNNVAIEVYQS